MQLTIDGSPRTFTPLPAFRQHWGLPEEFGVAYFEPKEWQGLGSIDHAGAPLEKVKQQVLRVVPRKLAVNSLLDWVEPLTEVFRRALIGANEEIGLREMEIDFAVAGFRAITQAVADHLLRLAYAAKGDVSRVREHYNYAAVYQGWLDNSVEVSGVTHEYVNGEARFDVRVIYFAYGRVGLEVRAADAETHYVVDTSLTCPAASYMQELCGEVGGRLCEAVTDAPR